MFLAQVMYCVIKLLYLFQYRAANFHGVLVSFAGAPTQVMQNIEAIAQYCSLCNCGFDRRAVKTTCSFIPPEFLVRYVDYKMEQMLTVENKAERIYAITIGGVVLEVLEELQPDEGISLQNLVTTVSRHANEGQYILFLNNDVKDTAQPFCVAERRSGVTRNDCPRGFTLTRDDYSRNGDTIIHLGCPTFKIQADSYDASATFTVLFRSYYDPDWKKTTKHPVLESGYKCNDCDKVLKYLIVTLNERKKALCE